jgi:hypothetical protein
MKLTLASAAILFLVSLPGLAQNVEEWKLDLAQYGLVKASCARYIGKVEFLDNDHLVINAPVTNTCDKKNWDKPIDTRITEIDLQGREVASVRRSDVVEFRGGLVGFVTVCTGDRIDFLSRNLQVANSITLSETGKDSSCYLVGGRSPSRTAMAIAGPARTQHRLYRGSSNTPITDITTSKSNSESVRAVADDGFLVCSKEKRQCNVVNSRGVEQSFALPVLGGGTGDYIVGLVTPERLLVASYDGKRLYAETPTGENIPIANIAKIRPSFIGSSSIDMSAEAPRRILYSVDGCLLGDFDDCYGIMFRRFAVFDSQTSRMLFRHNYAPGATVRISPNGQIVLEQDGAKVHLFRISTPGQSGASTILAGGPGPSQLGTGETSKPKITTR